MFAFNLGKQTKAVLREMEKQNAGYEAHIKDLERKLHMCEPLLDGLQAELQTLRKREDETVKASRMVGVKFNSWFKGELVRTAFNIGLGPCGKTVEWFRRSQTDTHLTITQIHTDGTHKEFVYKLSDIEGRIEYEHGMVTLTGVAAEAEKARRNAMLVKSSRRF